MPDVDQLQGLLARTLTATLRRTPATRHPELLARVLAEIIVLENPELLLAALNSIVEASDQMNIGDRLSALLPTDK